jgi:hypothetical protein
MPKRFRFRSSFLRDLALLMFAGVVGWWAHGVNTPVQAQHSSSDTARGSGELGFQFGGAGLEGSLTLYNPENRTLYVYPSAAANSHINCAFSIHVERPGAPLERQNCPVGSLFSH